MSFDCLLAQEQDSRDLAVRLTSDDVRGDLALAPAEPGASLSLVIAGPARDAPPEAA